MQEIVSQKELYEKEKEKPLFAWDEHTAVWDKVVKMQNNMKNFEAKIAEVE